MEWRGVKRLRAVLCALCAVAVVGWGLPAAAALLPNLSEGTSQDAQEAADMADAHSGSSVLRALSAMPVKASADKAASADPRTDATAKPASPASASKSDPQPLGETLHTAAKDLAVNTGAVDAKQYLSTEFGSDKAPDGNAEADSNVLRRRANGDTSGNAANANAPVRSAEQMKLDEEQASFLASALAHEVIPWAMGAAVLVGCAQGLRAILALSRRKSERRRRHRRSSSTRKARP